MARITVEDCLPNVDNLFQLVLLAAARARRLANGAEPTVPLDNDKVTVIALREIAEGNITPEMLLEPEPAPEPIVNDIDAQLENFRAPAVRSGGLTPSPYGLCVLAAWPDSRNQRKAHSRPQGIARQGRALPSA